ncbi:hypothetical protein SAMN05444266_101649 [Chitinophaga jiangningensis]|uniref:Uncharacterized protein n=1 Tax=Chitinophaga jiangningensis TaxID=1419482 RepID=A0A1M6WJN0_9BACT|nr:hypothetical protein [Chitinophaga jiangningensis]SHK93809.1 hypothetical protein SAMN05444266_101649 [Chitinophaga jiangningensis]
MYANNIKVEPRASKSEKLKEQRSLKLALSKKLIHGDAREITVLMNMAAKEDPEKYKPIHYGSVANALNPESHFWSDRVYEFAMIYADARQSKQDEQQ